VKLIIESTDQTTRLDGTLCRLWRGKTEGGNPVDVFVMRVGSGDPAACRELAAGLCEMPPPREAALADVIGEGLLPG
jgi:hypothetical protein